MHFAAVVISFVLASILPSQSLAKQILTIANNVGTERSLNTNSQLPEKATVDMLLCLAADVSESVTEEEYLLQRQGHAAAIEDPQVIEAIKSGANGRIAAVYLEWAKQDQQFLNVDWHVIDGTSSANAFAKKISGSPMPPWIASRVRNTSTSEAIRYCLRQFQAAPVASDRRVIDISSDGTNNIGAKISVVRDEAVARGAVINALAIVGSKNPFPYATHENPAGGLGNYFEKNVVGGTGAFVHVAVGYASFAEMIKRKFLLELSSIR